MTHHNQIIGGFGERLAGGHLVAHGLVVLDRNWRGSAGEIDLVARDGPDLVFVEVKTRRSVQFGQPVESVVPAKARRLRKAASQWLSATRPRYRELRFDVVSVLLTRGERHIEHLRGAF